jgi:mono/diheme cytochrome c family protein
MPSLSLGSGLVVTAFALVASSGCRADLNVPPQVCSTQAVSSSPSERMEPGGDCIGCHASGEGPGFVIAGTVMNALDDDTNCAGVAGVTVRIKGADGAQIELVTNEVGNFYLRPPAGTLAFPFSAEVSRNGVTVPMLTSRSAAETNCASCHTAVGARAAPGRIVAP